MFLTSKLSIFNDKINKLKIYFEGVPYTILVNIIIQYVNTKWNYSDCNFNIKFIKLKDSAGSKARQNSIHIQIYERRCSL